MLRFNLDICGDGLNPLQSLKGLWRGKTIIILVMDLLNDSQWSIIDGEPCKVIDFTSLCEIKDGKIDISGKSMPYASVSIECKKIPQRVNGFITHKEDFINLWHAFNEQELKKDGELILFWSKKHYKNIIYKILSSFMPKLWIMICPKGAFEIMTDKNSRSDLIGEARWRAMEPIKEWKSAVIE